MKEVKRYKCDVCGCEYENIEEVQECEKYHSIPCSYVEHYRHSEKFPHEIIVHFLQDGIPTSVRYKPEQSTRDLTVEYFTRKFTMGEEK